jgi:amino-acid N-acetyltransferase
MSKECNFNIRKAAFADVHQIYELIKQHPAELLPRSISDIVKNTDRFVVTECKNKIVGTAAWEILPEIGHVVTPTIEIKSVAVDKKYQKSGIGTGLVKTVLKRIEEYRPVEILVLTFTPDFFRKFGFKEVSKKKIMHKIYMGCLNCTKYESPFTCPEVAMTLYFK